MSQRVDGWHEAEKKNPDPLKANLRRLKEERKEREAYIEKMKQKAEAQKLLKKNQKEYLKQQHEEELSRQKIATWELQKKAILASQARNALKSQTT